MNHPAVGDYLSSLVCITRFRCAVIAAHHTQSSHRTDIVCAVCWDYFEKEMWSGVHVLSGVNWLQRKRIAAVN